MSDWTPADGLPPEVNPPGMEEIEDNPEALDQLLEKLYEERGIDFRNYKRSTMSRRLAKRFRARKVKSYTDYIKLLDKNVEEYETLFDDLTVNETYFFRNQTIFETFQKYLITIIKNCSDDNRPLRIWSAGCSSGEEPYSVAMLVDHCLLEQQKILPEIQIFATDIDQNMLQKAKEGVYPRLAVNGIPTEFLQSYFSLENGNYKITPSLQKQIRFEFHNLAHDPPFENLDIILCRNVIIYFNIGLQMEVLRKFYHGLRDDGLLLLGEYEVAIREGRNLFTNLHFEAKLYRKRQRKQGKSWKKP